MTTSVLLYSSGMDSLCAAFLRPYDVLLRVPSNAAYDERERGACERLAALHTRWERVITITGMFDFQSIERADNIVPNRNAHLVLAASLHGDEIALAAVDGDRSCDKDEGFCTRMEAVLDHTWQRQHWTPARKFAVTLPVKHLSKAQLLRAALDAGMPHTALYLSYSCYEGGERACGVCKPCVRKYVAMNVCGVHVPRFVFAGAPASAPWLKDALAACVNGGWRSPAEDADFLRVF